MNEKILEESKSKKLPKSESTFPFMKDPKSST